MQGNKIKLPNRYNEEVYLEKIEDTKYRLVHKSYYVRLGTIDGIKDKYTFIDISGGPMISIGSKLPVGTVKSIGEESKNFIIEVE